MGDYIASRYDHDIKPATQIFFAKHKIDVQWECREDPGNTGRNVHYHAILKTKLKIATIRKYRQQDDDIPHGQENLTFSEIKEVDQFLNYIHKGEHVEETGIGKTKKYIAHTKSHPMITKVPSIEPVGEDRHYRQKINIDQWSDKFYHDRFWDLMENMGKVIKSEKDKQGIITVHQSKLTTNDDFIKYMRKYLTYKTVLGNTTLIERITMQDIIKKITDYYRLHNKDYDQIVINKKLHLFYATVVRDTDPITYNAWIDHKAQLAIEAGFIPPKCLKDEVAKYRIPDDEDYLENK